MLGQLSRTDVSSRDVKVLKVLLFLMLIRMSNYTVKKTFSSGV